MIAFLTGPVPVTVDDDDDDDRSPHHSRKEAPQADPKPEPRRTTWQGRKHPQAKLNPKPLMMMMMMMPSTERPKQRSTSHKGGEGSHSKQTKIPNYTTPHAGGENHRGRPHRDHMRVRRVRMAVAATTVVAMQCVFDRELEHARAELAVLATRCNVPETNSHGFYLHTCDYQGGMGRSPVLALGLELNSHGNTCRCQSVAAIRIIDKPVFRNIGNERFVHI